MNKPYYNADMAYDEVKKYKDELTVKVVIAGKESQFDLSGYVVDIVAKVVSDVLAKTPVEK